VVFEKPPSPPIRSSVIKVTHAPRAGANSADNEIVRRVRAAANPSLIRVVTSDIVLSDIVRAAGAVVTSAEMFRSDIET
jgi:uncharacterized protein YaiI (UPF0178 family)